MGKVRWGRACACGEFPARSTLHGVHTFYWWLSRNGLGALITVSETSKSTGRDDWSKETLYSFFSSSSPSSFFISSAASSSSSAASSSSS